MSGTRALEGQVAIVTGGVRRIGKATALALAKDGATVIINALKSRDEAEAAVAEIQAAGGKAVIQLGDVADEKDMADLAARAMKDFGRIDILVNNAAVRGEAAFTEMTLDQWRGVTRTILDGAFVCSRAVLPSMVAARYGRIISMGGVSAHLGAGGRAHVVAAKAGIVGLTRALATEFAAYGITVNCVVPGKIGGQRSHTSGQGIQGQPPVGREGVPEDVADLVHNLCQPRTSYITGQTIHVSGGLFMP
ncbi:MAG: SDR family oxidoreductase [Beijerinckiaceae bacterium]|jgi:3-oxoacyl-[acyl-carrier protein] reductase|nr:SDR family oxidoreductase [Beijerinckiaceae bacterium]MDO9440126.1 SDR family oxidoreductase [Beijerinckiaceae bacterium]